MLSHETTRLALKSFRDNDSSSWLAVGLGLGQVVVVGNRDRFDGEDEGGEGGNDSC